MTSQGTAGYAVMKTLRGYGIDTVFGIPGTHNLEFYRPLNELGIRAVTSRHEQGAGYGADGWSLRTGKPGVVVTTSGPGLLNVLSAAGTAYCESRPMIIFSPGPAVGAEFTDEGRLHETKDQLGAAAAIVDRAVRVTSIDEAVAEIHAAFQRFASDRPRPIYIEIPLDVLEADAGVPEEDLLPKQLPKPVAAEEEALDRAATLLRSAKSPVILAGGGSRGACAELLEIVELLTAPIVTTVNAKGVVNEQHPLSLGSNLRLPAIRERARDADVLLIVGSKLGEAELWVDRLDARGTVVRIDVLDSQINKNQSAEVALVGDASATLRGLLDRLYETEPAQNAAAAENSAQLDARSDAARNTEQRVAAALEKARSESAAISPVNAALGDLIQEALPPDAIVTTDSSQVAYMGLVNALRVTEPNSMLYMGTYATLGYGLPAALGAAIASDERPVFAVVGDGALMFCVNEFTTIVEQDVAVTVIVVDNGGYGEIKQNEEAEGIEAIGVDLVQPDWPALATAFGGAGRTVTSPEELHAAVAAAIAGGGLQLIHIKQDEFDLHRNSPREGHSI